MNRLLLGFLTASDSVSYPRCVGTSSASSRASTTLNTSANAQLLQKAPEACKAFFSPIHCLIPCCQIKIQVSTNTGHPTGSRFLWTVWTYYSTRLNEALAYAKHTSGMEEQIGWTWSYHQSAYLSAAFQHFWQMPMSANVQVARSGTCCRQKLFFDRFQAINSNQWQKSYVGRRD